VSFINVDDDFARDVAMRPAFDRIPGTERQAPVHGARMIRINDSDITTLCDRLDSRANCALLSDAERLDLHLAATILRALMRSGALDAGVDIEL
jgi:hypothetical protein